MELIRAFIAIEPPHEVREQIAELVSQLRKLLRFSRVKWVEPHNLHLTLKFMAEVEEDVAREGLRRLRVSMSPDLKSFPLTLKGLGVFPSWRAPRVIWIGVDRESHEEMRRIATALDRSYESLGVASEDREFKAHLTLGRVKGRMTQKDLDVLRHYKDKLGNSLTTFTANELVLFKSTLTPSGPIYEALDRLTLER